MDTQDKLITQNKPDTAPDDFFREPVKRIEGFVFHPEPEAPIGVFDSGLGGISVLRAMVRVMPNENFLYLGDSLHAPYGTKTRDEVRALTYRSFHTMMDKGVKAVAIACNTATSAAVRSLRADYPEVPLIGIEPALKPATLHKEHSRIAVMATPMTLKEEKFRYLLERFGTDSEVIPLPCPGLMEYVEKGILDGPELEEFLKEKLSMLPAGGVDSIVLGCTHYPFIRQTLQKLTGPDTAIFDGSTGCAREMRRRICEKNLQTDRTGKGKVEFINTLDTPEMKERALRLFNLPEEYC